jgi:hypothetical protein
LGNGNDWSSDTFPYIAGIYRERERERERERILLDSVGTPAE